jgi:hypothetical protein
LALPAHVGLLFSCWRCLDVSVHIVGGKLGVLMCYSIKQERMGGCVEIYVKVDYFSVRKMILEV